MPSAASSPRSCGSGWRPNLGPQDEALRRGDVEAIRAWLGEHVRRYGRRLDTEPLVEQATGGGIDAGPFLRYATAA